LIEDAIVQDRNAAARASAPSIDMEQFVCVRREFHSHPELSHEEVRTSQTIARLLTGWGYQVHTGIGGHGVVGVLKRGQGSKSIALRADFDALAVQEESSLPHASRRAGKMHACGHDGHAAVLLAAAYQLGLSPDLNGTLVTIFQPAEETGRGAKAMIADGLLERFPFDAIFGLHNVPDLPTGSLGFRSGPFWAAVDNLDIVIQGFGGHGGRPNLARDPLVAGAHMVTALQTIVSRAVDPFDPSVVTIGAFKAGTVNNVIPDKAELAVNVRSFAPSARELILNRIREISAHVAGAFGVSCELRFDHGTPAVVNDPAMTTFARNVAEDLMGTERVHDEVPLMSFSDDFAEFLLHRPGSYLVVGNGEASWPLHHPKYDFNDEVIAPAASYWYRLVHAFLNE
jgi:hippurate hydrolase